MSEHSAHMVEIFSSIQGEGILVGLRQIFLRFHACNIDCIYCDTRNEVHPEFCATEEVPGRQFFNRTRNPVELEQILPLLDNWLHGWPGIHHSISLTGGEPLLHHKVLAEWLPALKDRLPTYLETNGTLCNELTDLIDFLDHIGMDIKLPSTSGLTELWERHREFLKIAASKNVFVKAVISDETEDWEITRAAGVIASANRNIPLILQPVTLAGGRIGISPVKMLELQEIASSHLSEVRVIPQTHKFIGQL